LESLGVGVSDEDIVPTLIFTVIAEVVRYMGVNPIFADSNPVTLNIDVEAIKATITP